MMPEPQTRILIIDNQPVFNDGLKSLLDEQPGLIVCGQVFQASHALPAIQRTNPHLILLDINLHGVNGIDLGKTILAHYAAIRIVVITMYDQPRLVEEARQGGLHGYLLKNVSTPDLLRAIETVMAGHTCFDPTVPTAAPSQKDPATIAQELNLTFREIDVIKLIKEGLSNDQIARRLHLSIDTVKTHRKNIYFKLGINKVTDLIRFANEHGL